LNLSGVYDSKDEQIAICAGRYSNSKNLSARCFVDGGGFGRLDGVVDGEFNGRLQDGFDFFEDSVAEIPFKKGASADANSRYSEMLRELVEHIGRFTDD
jgi:hypothetical protein